MHHLTSSLLMLWHVSGLSEMCQWSDDSWHLLNSQASVEAQWLQLAPENPYSQWETPGLRVRWWNSFQTAKWIHARAQTDRRIFFPRNINIWLRNHLGILSHCDTMWSFGRKFQLTETEQFILFILRLKTVFFLNFIWNRTFKMLRFYAMSWNFWKSNKRYKFKPKNEAISCLVLKLMITFDCNYRNWILLTEL